MKLPDLRLAELQNKRVFLRLDLDVPLIHDSESRIQVEDDARLWATYETVQFLLEQNARVIIAGHLGRPDGRDEKFTLKPVAYWYERKLNISISEGKIGEFSCWNIGDVSILENLRFYPGEESGDLEFTRELSSLADIYVNDAFGNSHRNHASITGVPKLLPHYAGIRLQKEVEELSKVLENPSRPLVIVIGGEKIETKLPLVEKMLKIADHVLVGGEIVSRSEILLRRTPDSEEYKLVLADLNQDGTDINDESVQKFTKIIKTAKTIVWNGPMGKIIANSKEQIANSEKGTREVANAIVESSAHTIVGGGDTVGFLKREGLIDKFSFVSTGGGAMLEFLSGEKLPGLEALL